MPCPAPDRVLDYLARRLETSERDAIVAHLDTCAACRQLIVELGRTDLEEVVGIARPKEPTQIGRYKVEKRLGEGGMGTVYAAYDPQLDRKVAIKLVHPELAKRGGFERLLREGRALARLSHPNVVRVYDADRDRDQVYVAMELVEGETLATWLGVPRTWRAIVEKFVAAGRGLAAAHRAAIIHRDVKPENILVDREGCAKVADFGLAGHSDPVPALISPDKTDPMSRLTEPGTVMGTPMFMSPEQREGQEVGPSTDQYSLCAALSSALFADTPQRKIPGWLRRAIDRGLSTLPADRFTSIEELVLALDPWRRARRIRNLAVAAAVTALVGGGLALYAATRDGDPTGAACAIASSERTRLWSSEEASAVTTALHATHMPFADDTAIRVDTAIRDYLKTLAAAEATVCSQDPRSATTRAAFDQGLTCLAQRRGEVAMLIERLRRTSAHDLRFVVSQVHELPPVEECANPLTLAAEAAARSTPAGALTRVQIAVEIGAAREHRAAGRFHDALSHAKRAVTLARIFGGVILVKALLELGEISAMVEGFPASEAVNREAITIAEMVHADELRASAMTRTLATMARAPGREREALGFAPLVDAAIDRVGKRTALLPLARQSRGIAHMALGEGEAAIADLQAALTLAREVLPPGDPRLPDYVYVIGVVLDRTGHASESKPFHEEAHRLAAEVWGPNHPNTVRFEINLAANHALLGDCDKALGELAHARSVLTGVLPDDSPEQLHVDQAMGGCYYIQHKHGDAVREYTARQTALIAAGRGKSAEMASSWMDLGDVELDRAAYAAAAAQYRRAVTELEDIVGKNDVRLGVPLTRVAEAELGDKHPERAIAPLERALAIYTTAKTPPVVVADATFPLGRALWSRPADRARARELATQARDAFAAAGAAYTRQRDSADAWLATHR